MNRPGNSHIGLIVKNAGLDTIGTAFNIVFMFASSVVITRTIGAELFGKYSLAASLFQVLSVFAVFGLNVGVVRLASKYNARGDAAGVKGSLYSGMIVTLWFSIAITLVIMILAPLVSHRAFSHVEGFDMILRVYMLSLPFFALMMVIAGYTQGLKTLKYSVIVELVARPLIRLLVIVGLFLAGLRLFAVLFGALASYVAAAVMIFYFARKISPFDFKRTAARLVTKEIFVYSVPLVFARFMNVVITRSNNILVGVFKDATSTGLFGAAASVSPFISLGLGSFGKIFAPVISELWERGEHVELEATFKAVTKWVISLGLPIFLVLLLFSPELLVVFGKDFPRAAMTLRLLSVGQMVDAGVGPIGFILSMTGRQNLNLINSIILAAVNVALNVMLIPRYGIAGAGLATSISFGLLNIVRVVQVKILYGFTPFRRDVYKPAAAGIITLAIFYFAKSRLAWEGLAGTLALCAAFMVVYVVLLYLFGLKEEKEVLYDILRRRK
jgi:O-antigen/teichoic acid export membrane protein